jgi:hypothetical protein
MTHDSSREPSRTPSDESPRRLDDEAPLEPWMLDLAKNAVDELDADIEVPKAMMWKRIEHQRQRTAAAPIMATTAARSPWRLRQFAAVAAVLVGGVAIGRYLVPSASPTLVAAGDSATVQTGTRGAIDGDVARRSDPSHVAMQEHLVQTVALLAAVQTPTNNAKQPELGPWASDLLATTRLLIDQPQLRDERTRRLLQDLELVLVQIVQARSSAPETQRAPQETMREIDLLTRVRAVVTASNANEPLISGGYE